MYYRSFVARIVARIVARVVVRVVVTVIAVLCTGCVSTSRHARPPGVHSCESFFIYVLCVTDANSDGSVDYMYFDDTREIFMYDGSPDNHLLSVMPLHRCAIPMDRDSQAVSSRLLYEDLGLAERLALKGNLIRNYRSAQAAVDACYNKDRTDAQSQPFLDDEDWDEGE